MTRKQMQDQVVNWLGLQDIDSFNETSMVNDLLYQGTVDLLARTRCTVRCVQLRVQAGQDEYTLDHGILALVDVENGARPRLRRNQSDDYGFTLIRCDLLLVKPTPGVDGTIQVWGVMRPQQMAAGHRLAGDGELRRDSRTSTTTRSSATRCGRQPTTRTTLVRSRASATGSSTRARTAAAAGSGRSRAWSTSAAPPALPARRVTVKALNSHDSYVG